MEIAPSVVPKNDSHTEALFNVSARNQMDLIAIADNKANVITAISVLLITAIIAFLSSGISVSGIPLLSKMEFVIPLSIMLAFCSISAICAILALKPKIIRTKKKDGKSVLFFHNFYRKTLAEYKDDMRTVLQSRERVYDQLITDMYYNGLVLEQKYALLGFSYTVFLLAIVCSLVAYVITAVM